MRCSRRCWWWSSWEQLVSVCLCLCIFGVCENISPSLPAGLDTANIAYGLRGELQRDAGVALDLVCGPGPRPRRVPDDRAPAQRVQARTLLAARVVTLAQRLLYRM